MTPELVTVGGLTVDNVVAADGTVALDQAGGNGAYAAVGALSLVDRVGLVSHAVASYPQETLRRLEAGGVDLGGVVFSDGRLTAGSWFLYDADGQRQEGLTAPAAALAETGLPTDRLTPARVARWRAALAARPTETGYSEFRQLHPLRAAQIPKAWRDARGVHLAPSGPDVMRDMIAHFAPRGATITADPGSHLSGLPLDAIADILRALDAFLPSEVEARALVPGAAPSDALAVLAENCPGAVAVKLGPAGVLVWDRASEASVMIPAATARTLDPTGAGDAFCGGFLAGLTRTGDPMRAAQQGVQAAARVVECFGADGTLCAGATV
ncbi:carbohydrate kinase family protein [Thalassococcus sp. S3]|uniref:carbohydrate kinase family protein n=1 Tax=Thalassococcus sp. S3 TaxID=2017482 RepID=UPI0010247D83|nr:carbohydrate kinase family protein [Thalassococcus sp. S3]QBF32056.1 ribokinase [Thalassococcus sp. S3]